MGAGGAVGYPINTPASWAGDTAKFEFYAPTQTVYASDFSDTGWVARHPRKSSASFTLQTGATVAPTLNLTAWQVELGE